MPPAGATDAEIDAQIKQLLSYSATYEDIDEDREVVEGDVHLRRCSRTSRGTDAPRRSRIATDLPSPRARRPNDGRRWSRAAPKARRHQGDHLGPRAAGETTSASRHNLLDQGGREVHQASRDPTELTDEIAKKSFGYVRRRYPPQRREGGDRRTTRRPRCQPQGGPRRREAVGAALKLDEVPAEYQNEIFNELATEVPEQASEPEHLTRHVLKRTRHQAR